jgi:hypothetical protein
MYARVVSTHDERDPNSNSILIIALHIAALNAGCFADKHLLIIDEISGLLEHSPECLKALVMTQNPTIPLHPELREHALSLLRNLVPIGRVRLLCTSWAQERWGTSPGDNQYRFTLVEYESTSLYRTLRREGGIPERLHVSQTLTIGSMPLVLSRHHRFSPARFSFINLLEQGIWTV